MRLYRRPKSEAPTGLRKALLRLSMCEKNRAFW
jgi:hypothetical protein